MTTLKEQNIKELKNILIEKFGIVRDSSLPINEDNVSFSLGFVGRGDSDYMTLEDIEKIANQEIDVRHDWYQEGIFMSLDEMFAALPPLDDETFHIIENFILDNDDFDPEKEILSSFDLKFAIEYADVYGEDEEETKANTIKILDTKFGLTLDDFDHELYPDSFGLIYIGFEMNAYDYVIAKRNNFKNNTVRYADVFIWDDYNEEPYASAISKNMTLVEEEMVNIKPYDFSRNW